MKKHDCPDCTHCQWCADDRCRLCLSRDACRRKLSFDEQIALYESLNGQADGAGPDGEVLKDQGNCGEAVAGGEAMKDARANERIEAPLDIHVTWPAMGQVKRATTKDFSDGGAFVYVVFDPRPAIEDEMSLQLNGSVLGKEPPVLKARVVRVTDEGVAFRFVRDEAE